MRRGWNRPLRACIYCSRVGQDEALDAANPLMAAAEWAEVQRWVARRASHDRAYGPACSHLSPCAYRLEEEAEERARALKAPLPSALWEMKD